MQPSVQTNLETSKQPSVEATQTSAINPSAIHPSTIHPMQPIQTPQPAIRRTYPSWLFFQRISRWSTEQLDALNISQHDMITPRVLIGEEYIPTRRDRDAVYTNLLRAFTEPSEFDIVGYDPASTMMRNNQLRHTFQLLGMIFDIIFKNEPLPCTVDMLISQLGMPFALFRDNFIVDREDIPFHLLKFNMRGTLHCNGGIYHHTDRKRRFPLVVFAHTTKTHHRLPHPTNHELASTLLPMTTEYDHGLTRPKYTGFSISAHGTEYRITRADASHTYFEDLRHGRLTREKLIVLRTVKYNLLWREDREEFFEAFYAMCGFLGGYWGGKKSLV
ncbi:uncharacterized protein BO80DRAFT_351800 [Aspergillus ibericus CBS 121593]|uniref:Uncharacterized protein n=1 Tax=Aspergillus ibericus CBS 121593 TaxID=1448316 RepID=A0A395H4I0_9EURO|nr:hypothetical protein BO80DRAFT_351800 [Aspergillus ibericus CBS 121593]RAL02550.1 hypothetical protein BO80DRAFT_351800 [Aspergillus ibericus CBS 121593]